jgi:hypothetical protein
MTNRLLKKSADGPKRHTGRDPWFERPFDRPFDRLTVLSKVEGLTTLSEVEGISSKIWLFADSPPQADFATSGMTDLLLARKILTYSAPS